MPNWTEEQKAAIFTEGNNILVSAGAGSGKTEVLSERALQKVKAGVNIDQILILTFTKAAAYEMMLRIRKKLEDNGLEEQASRIDKAYITTFDSFSLSVIKKYHHYLNLSKNISIIDENVISLVKKEALDTIFDEYYLANEEHFLNLITNFSLRDDKEIKKYILDVNNKMDLKYDKKHYLENYISYFYNPETVQKQIEEYENYLRLEILKIKNTIEDLGLVLDGDSYSEFLDSFQPLLESRDYNEIKNNIAIKIPRLPKNSQEESKLLKEELAKSLKELESMCQFENKESMREIYLSTREDISIIINIITKLDQKIMDYKYENNTFEFTDIARLAIELVTMYPEVRDELKNYFKEIMIDEYQDTSDLQEQFIQLIADHNTYMVGDIKQSIYRFRNANPLIFKNKYNDYTNRIDGIKIDLNKNFRSRKEVLDNINEFFIPIMDEDFGGANYKESHQMIYGNQTYLQEGFTNQNYNINILNYCLEKDSIYKKYTNDEIEAFIIACDIEKKVKEKYQVFDKNFKKVRNIEYKDFVILMDRSSRFNLYKKIFEYKKIPLTILKDENIMDQNEVYLIRNILKLIECVERENFENSFHYSFISIARSYLFSYTDQEIYRIVNHNLYFSDAIYQLVKAILEKLPRLSLKELISTIIKEFNFSQKMITVGNIQMGMAVLDYFLELSSSLQELGYDYHRFIIYLDEIIESGKEIRIPLSVSDHNSCQIMTIHKSKGLEYPICYYSGLSSSFNISDLKEKVLFDSQYGIVIPSFLNGYQDTFYKLLLRKKYLKEEISERIRLFYVALTRCREQMILITNLKEDDNQYVYSPKKDNYRSFIDILKSISPVVENYIENISLENLNITDKYKILNPPKDFINQNNTLLNIQKYQTENQIVETSNYSKSILKLMNNNAKTNVEFGKRMHLLFEMIDFKNPDKYLSLLSDSEKKLLFALLNQPLFKRIQEANILKEYAFITNSSQNMERHGVIDLMLEYPDHIDIIDYKLKNINDKEYIKQLHGYQSYIQSRTKKPVFIYLYSILESKLEEIE